MHETLSVLRKENCSEFEKTKRSLSSGKRARKRNILSWRDTLKDAELDTPQKDTPSGDEDQHELSPKRRRVSHTGLTCEVSGVALTANGAQFPLFKENNDAFLSPVPFKIEGNNDLFENPKLHCSFPENFMNESVSEEANVVHFKTPAVEDIQHDLNTSSVAKHGGSLCDNRSEQGNARDRDQESPYCSPEYVFESNSDQSSNWIDTRHASQSRNSRVSPDGTRVSFPPDSFVTPGRGGARCSRESRVYHEERRASGNFVVEGSEKDQECKDKLFQTPVGKPPRHFQTASVTKIRFQSPMEISCDVPPRGSVTTPKRRNNQVRMRPVL